MNKAFAGDPYIRKVLEIVGLIASDKKGQRSVFDDITAFFVDDAKSTRQQQDLKIAISVLQDKIAEGVDGATDADLHQEIAKLDAAKQADKDARTVASLKYKDCVKWYSTAVKVAHTPRLNKKPQNF